MAAMQVFNTRSYGHSGSELMRLASADSRGRIEQLYEMLAHLDGVTSLDAALREILRSSLELLGADSGYIRLFGAPSIETEVDARLAIGPIAAQSGFSEAYVDYFSSLRRPVINEARSEVYGGRQVLIADVMTNPAFLAHRDVVVGEGFHSMQVTPLIDEAATRHVGAIVACHEGIYTPPPEILALVTLYTRRVSRSGRLPPGDRVSTTSQRGVDCACSAPGRIPGRDSGPIEATERKRIPAGTGGRGRVWS